MSELGVERIEKDEGRTRIYRLRGVLGETHFAYELADEMREALQGDLERLILNLSQVEHITSSGVGVVATGFTSAQRARKTFRLVGVTPRVRRILDLSGILGLVQQFETEDEALAS
ncbi:MAG: STAS domain-containing protein [Planctomycetota bacterium]|jgi:anti-sigma B factor antagonist